MSLFVFINRIDYRNGESEKICKNISLEMKVLLHSDVYLKNYIYLNVYSNL